MTAELLRQAADLLDAAVADERLPASPWAYHADGSMIYHGGNGRTRAEMLAEIDRLNAGSETGDLDDADWQEFDDHFHSLHNCDIDPPLGRFMEATQPAVASAVAVWLRAVADAADRMATDVRPILAVGVHYYREASAVARAVTGVAR